MLATGAEKPWKGNVESQGDRTSCTESGSSFLAELPDGGALLDRMCGILISWHFSAVANYCELFFFLSRGHFGVGRFARREALGVSEGRLLALFPPGHAAVLRCGI